MRRKNIVTIGGGTGSFMLLSGLKKYPVNLAAIVSMTDDGGSTGVLRDELGVLPPGDVRQCLVALSDSSKELRELMNYRFAEGGLKGHSFGNLFLSALEKINHSFSKGVEKAARILDVRGEVIPVTETDIVLCMDLQNGVKLAGEEEINHNRDLQRAGIKKFYLRPRAKASSKAIKQLLAADLIVIGPGNHYCSIAPNFLVDGIPQAIRKSKAKVVYNCNLVNKSSHTDGYFLEDYVTALNGLIGAERIDFVTFNSRRPDAKLIKKYAKTKDLLVKVRDLRGDHNYQIIMANLLSNSKPKFSAADAIAAQRSFIRHDGAKLAKTLMSILQS
ncbi:YvcK family protein [Patescibacteria group bacterium]|nr:MAG: YvcK family protein [Patescibacteria group bacterium]